LFRDEIESTTTYPVIGEIAYNKTKSPIVTGRNNKTFIAEQFRQLRVLLSMHKFNLGSKRILVTSTISGEGKSFVALNLASTFALSGKRIILLDLDLNNPAITRKVNISNEPGLSDFLQGKCDVVDIIRKTDIHDNLYFIPCGSPSEDHPTELLENGKINDLLEYLNGLFDHIIIDTAPVSSITDAYLLSSKCDITLYIIRHGYTPKIFIERLDQNNQNNQLDNVVIVYNGIRARGFGKHHYGYGYGYGYAYHEENKLPGKV
jgi:capsular exopolysaccharide synthesis family protein